MTVHKSDGVDGKKHTLVRTTTLFATEAVVAGEVVQIDDGALAALITDYGAEKLVRVADLDDTPLAVGIALEDAAAPAVGGVTPIKVQYAGKIGFGDTGAPTSIAAIAVGLMVGSSLTAGDIRAAVAPTGVLFPFAFTLVAYGAADDSGSICILDKGLYS